MFTFLLVVHAIIAAALVAVILMQRSEGGGLGMGGSPSGLMSARGAADFLTRATTVLATLFVVMCVFLAVLAATRGAPTSLDSSLVRTPAAGAALPPAPVPTSDPLAGGNAAAPAPVTVPTAAAPVTPAPEAKAPAVKAEKAERKAAPAPANTAAPKIAPPPVVVTTPAPATNGSTPQQ